MPTYNDSLRGYAFEIHKRDGFKCVYCGLEGTKSFSAWLNLSWDHLLPKGHPYRDNPDYIVTACKFCNGADNQYFSKALERGITFDGKSPEDLVAQRKSFVMETRKRYQEFWETNVKPAAT